MIVELKDAACLTHAARRWLPPSRTGKPVHSSVLHRWAEKGIRGIRLQTWRVGGQRMTTQAALEEFLQKLNADSPAAEREIDTEVARRAKEAGAALERLGC